MAGTNVETRSADENYEKIVFDWVGDASGGSVPSTATAQGVYGYVVRATTIPGTGVPPTALYDIVINDEDGVDVMGGALANRAQAGNEQAVPLLGGAYGPCRVNTSALTCAVSGNSVNSATGKIILWIDREK